MKFKLLIAAVLAALLTGLLWQGSKDRRTVVSDYEDRLRRRKIVDVKSRSRIPGGAIYPDAL